MQLTARPLHRRLRIVCAWASCASRSRPPHPPSYFPRRSCSQGLSIFIELRLDALAKPAAALPDIKDFLARRRDITAIATCRRKPFGGKFTGSLNCRARNPRSKPPKPAARSSISKSSRPSSAPGPAGQVPRRAPRRRRRAPHQLRTTSPAPRRPKASIKPPSASPPSSPTSSKSSPRPALWPTISPSCSMIEDQSLNAHVVGIAMGEEGLISRVLGPARRRGLHLCLLGRRR